MDLFRTQLELAEKELEDSIELCKVLIKQINKESMYLYQKKTVLLTGRGGMGKTHLLCDITKQWISNQIPAFLFFGE